MEIGFTQKQMSGKLGITQSQYSKIETGETDPTKYLNKLSKILKCDPNDVFSGQILKDMEEEFITTQLRKHSVSITNVIPTKYM